MRRRGLCTDGGATETVWYPLLAGVADRRLWWWATADCNPVTFDPGLKSSTRVAIETGYYPPDVAWATVAEIVSDSVRAAQSGAGTQTRRELRSSDLAVAEQWLKIDPPCARPGATSNQVVGGLHRLWNTRSTFGGALPITDGAVSDAISVLDGSVVPEMVPSIGSIVRTSLAERLDWFSTHPACAELNGHYLRCVAELLDQLTAAIAEPQ